MRRPPNFTTSQWSLITDLWKGSWTSKAECGGHRYLPWTGGSDEQPPTSDELALMGLICGECEVITMCARYALNGNKGRGVEGGFYAGVWLPWVLVSDTASDKSTRVLARRQLRSLLVVKKKVAG